MASPPAGPMFEALERGRTRYNARFAAARKGGATVDGDSFLIHLGNAVAPIVEAVHAEMPDRADGVLNTLFDVSLELFSASLLGPRNRSPGVGEVWAKLLPAVAKLVMSDPKLVAATLSNAAYNLGCTKSARPRDWLDEMLQMGSRCESVSELLEVGKVAAWRAGMPQYRASAIRAAKALRPAMISEMFDVAEGSAAMVLDRMLDDPWLTPAAAKRGSAGALWLVGSVGGFRGFGGEFLGMLKVAASSGSLFVTDGEGTWRIICDCFGQLLLRHDRMPRGEPPPADVSVSLDGGIHWGAVRASLPQLAGVNSFACDGHTLAVTLETSHHIYLIASADAAKRDGDV